MTFHTGMTLIEVDRETADRLTANAVAKGLTLAAYLRAFAAAIGSAPAAPENGAGAIQEFDRLLDELAAAPSAAPSLPIDFSRADAYREHD